MKQLTWILGALLAASCDSGGGSSGATGNGGGNPQVAPNVLAQNPIPSDFRLGDPIDGLTPTELLAFHRGRLVFKRRFKPSEGLGPFYNATACASCHSSPVPGGSAPLYRNFYIAVWGTQFNQFFLPPLLGPVIPFYGSGDDHAFATFTLEGGRTVIPPDYFGFPVTVAQRNSVPIFGTGLFEFVSDTTIMGNSDPDDADGDGISGRYNTDGGAIGRFGAKSQSNNVEFFTRGPLMNQMGVTSDPFLGSGGIVSLGAPPFQISTGPDDPLTDSDGVPDPEISHNDLGDLIAFSRFLAPPQKKLFTPEATNGELVFDQIGCTACHLPSLPSSRGPVEAYTDLLLHEMGPDLADNLFFGVPQPSSISEVHSGLEFRTQPLWGVSLHAPYLHDGRAETLEEAIELHGGEATDSRDDFLALPASDRADLITFLEHL
ncbi:MAG: hypothetical protein GY711_14010 [bacterium]|nr:hypothetical protein [bacterium]